MFRYLARRFLSAALVMLVVTFLMYVLIDIAIDPLEDLRTSTSPNAAQLMENRVKLLQLDVPSPIRYFWWLGGVGGCFIGQCDLGASWVSGQEVTSLLQGAIANSVKLVFVATFVSILLGVTVGLVSAIRQYTGFDYAITFITFLLYSLPVFWVAVLLKQYGAIEFNNFLRNPEVNWLAVTVIALIAGAFWMGAMGGSGRRRLINFSAGTLVTFGLLAFLFGSNWLLQPGIGLIGVTVSSLAAAFLVTHLSTGLSNKRALYAALTTAVLGGVFYYAMQWFFYFVPANWFIIIALFIVAVLVGVGVGFAFGGPDKIASARTASIVAMIASLLVFIDRNMQVWAGYSNLPQIRGRPIATIGAATPGLQGDFWYHTVDSFTHLLLPSIALVLISFATYTRYARGSMLEVMNQDYIRTARAKGLTERTVIMRHALRNALLPLASIVPVDIITLIGGAVLTETIFGWAGMGRMFVDSLGKADIDPVMAYILITGILAVVANIVADFVYAILDPRIRVNA
ncbi:ABC transporter permease [Brevibacterium otitidis]|uniref:ABC transporter permease n=1 Tax=Brevibacterium otitidis TaxID=53364 RepID=A0ABV5X496_9MICO|nr:hypothetical protein GCM10023233_16360 [Brevibacterium otitidis]